jgi:glycosyltransferase involved in cell wall biosynthesis
MRILIATAHRNMVGGVEKYLQQTLPCLAARGHQLALLYEFRFDPRREPINSPELQLPCCGTEESGVQAALNFLRDWKPDVVYSQGLEDANLQSIVLNEYPTVLYAHNYIGTCASGEKCHAFPIAEPCDRQFGPACLALYLPRRCGGLHPGTMFKMYQRTAQRNAQIPRYAAILVASAHMRREFERHGVKPERIHLAPLPNPSEGEHLSAPQKPTAPGNLLLLGRLTKLKGPADLLKAMPLAEKQLGRPLGVTVAGDGPERKRLERLAARNQLRAQFTGWLGSKQKEEVLSKTDLLVVPSLWPEPFGLVGIEAAAHGMPAVAYDVGGISDWLIAGYSGELAPGNPPTVQGLAEALVRALSDPSHYADLCRGAREVAGRFTLAAHVTQLERTLENSLQNARRSPAEAIHADA